MQTSLYSIDNVIYTVESGRDVKRLKWAHKFENIPFDLYEGWVPLSNNGLVIYEEKWQGNITQIQIHNKCTCTNTDDTQKKESKTIITWINNFW